MTHWFRKNVLLNIWGRGNDSRAKFKIGQEVRIISTPPGFEQWIGEIVKIRGMNRPDGDFEYITTKYPICLWEDRLEAV